MILPAVGVHSCFSYHFQYHDYTFAINSLLLWLEWLPLTIQWQDAILEAQSRSENNDNNGKSNINVYTNKSIFRTK